VPDEELDKVNLDKDNFHGDWNYSTTPIHRFNILAVNFIYNQYIILGIRREYAGNLP
jgi:hypothetical protein